MLEGSSTFLGFMALGLLVVLMVVRILTVIELRSQGEEYRKNVNRIGEVEDDLETSRRRYLIALKAEGVAKSKVSQMKTRLAGLKQHMEQIEMSAVQEQNRRHQEKEKALEMAVLQALGGPSQRDGHFARVMKIIAQLIDVAKLASNDEIIQAVQEKLAEMDKRGALDRSPDLSAASQQKEPEKEPKKEPKKEPEKEPKKEPETDPTRQILNRAARVQAAVESSAPKRPSQSG